MIGRKFIVVNEVEVQDSQPEQGESLLARRVLVGERTLDSCQRTSLFKTHCKSSAKVCKVIVDGGSTNKLVVEDMVYKIGLKRMSDAEWQEKGDGFQQNLFKPTRILLGFKTPQRENTHKTLTLVSKPSRMIRNMLIRLNK